MRRGFSFRRISSVRVVSTLTPTRKGWQTQDPANTKNCGTSFNMRFISYSIVQSEEWYIAKEFLVPDGLTHEESVGESYSEASRPKTNQTYGGSRLRIRAGLRRSKFSYSALN
jgi:hypothetical protein